MVTKTTLIIIKGKYTGEYAAWLLVNHKAHIKKQLLFILGTAVIALHWHSGFMLHTPAGALIQQFNIAITL
jgi:hypothetical protein